MEHTKRAIVTMRGLRVHREPSRPRVRSWCCGLRGTHSTPKMGEWHSHDIYRSAVVGERSENEAPA